MVEGGKVKEKRGEGRGSEGHKRLGERTIKGN